MNPNRSKSVKFFSEALDVDKLAEQLTRRIMADALTDRFAAELSAKWFKIQKNRLQAILKMPLKDNPEYWGWVFRDKVIPFFTQFQAEFDAIVVQDQARDSIKNRVEMAVNYVDSVADKLDATGKMNSGFVDFKDPASTLRWLAISAIHDKMKEQAKTVGDLFKRQWFINPSVIKRLIQKTLKAASPEELDSITNDQKYRTKYELLERVQFDSIAIKAIEKGPLDSFDPTKWVDRIFDMLQANYSEQAIQESGAFREFDLHGMKVIVDDRTLDPGDIEKYVHYLNEAYARLKAKGLAKVWYGEVFIQCQGCGGVNYNTGGGVGGHYVIGKDTVSIFVKPSQFIVELMAHELGHRHWFRHLTQEQRGRFESLIKVRPTARPPTAYEPQLLPEANITQAKAAVDELDKTLKGVVFDFRSAGIRAKKWSPVVKKFELPLIDAVQDFKYKIVDAVHSAKASATLTPEVRALFDDVLIESAKALTTIRDMSDPSWWNSIMLKEPEPTSRPDNIDDYWIRIFKKLLPAWVEKVNEVIDIAVTSAHIYIDFAVSEYNKHEQSMAGENLRKWNEQYETDDRPVVPVSDYGASNIDEAFAEVFAHYVLEYDITRDQVESFRAVMKTAADTHGRSVALMKWLSKATRQLGVAEHVYVVGGAVRNWILKEPIKDIDLVVDSVNLGKDSEWLAKKLQLVIPAPSNLTTNNYGVAILTVKGEWDLDGYPMKGEVVEIANARKESYGGDAGKGYKPDTVEPATIHEDTLRREFSFNTLLWRLYDLEHGPDKAEVIDLLGVGKQHLEDRELRTPADPDKTFSDDPTRLLRAVKFVAKYNFKIPPDMAASIKRNAPKLKQMPWDAIRKILVGDILEGPAPRESVKLLHDLGIGHVLGEMLHDEPGFATALARTLSDKSTHLILDLLDLGWVVKTPFSFLDQVGLIRLREVLLTNAEDPSFEKTFVQALQKPPLDQPRLFAELEIDLKARGSLVTVARQKLLAAPELALDPRALEAAVKAGWGKSRRIEQSNPPYTEKGASLTTRLIDRFKEANVIPFKPKKPGVPTVAIGGKKYVLSDYFPMLSDMIGEPTPGGAKLVDVGGEPRFSYLWAYDVEKKFVYMWRLSDGDEKAAGSARSFTSEIMVLERKGQLNRVEHDEIRTIERFMADQQKKALSSMKKLIEENADDWDRLAKKLALELFEAKFLPRIKAKMQEVESGVTPLGFKVNERLIGHRTPEEQAKMFVTERILNEYTLDAVDAYVKSKGVDPVNPPGDVQATSFARFEVIDEFYDEYFR